MVRRTGLASRVCKNVTYRASASVARCRARPFGVSPERAGNAGVVADEGLVRASRAWSARGSQVGRGDRMSLRAQALAGLHGSFEARRQRRASRARLHASFWLEEARCAGSARVCVYGRARGARARVTVRGPRRLAGREAAQERRQVQSLCEDRVVAGEDRVVAADDSQRTRAESHAEGHRAPERHAGAGLYSERALFDVVFS